MRGPLRRRDVLKASGVAALAVAGCLSRPAREDADVHDSNRTGDPIPIPSDGGEADHEPSDPTSRVLDDFQDLSGWDVRGGSLSPDVDVYVTGDRSARIEVAAHDTRAVIRRSFPDPVDLSGLHPHLAVRTEETIYPRVRLVDVDGDAVTFRSEIRGGLRYQHFDFGIASVDGDPDLGAIASVQLSQYVGTDDRLRLWVDDLRVTPRPSPGEVLIHFDDTVETDYTAALPILQAHDMRASTFVNPGYVGREVGGERRLTISQLDALREAGWDVGSHGMYHTSLGDGSPDRVEAGVGDAYHWLRDHGFESGARFFVYPRASYDQQALDVVGEYHDLAFAGGWAAVGRCGNAHAVPRAAGEPSFEDAREVIDRTHRFGGRSILFYHALHDEQRSEFERTIEHLARRRDADDVVVRTVGDVDEAIAYDPTTDS